MELTFATLNARLVLYQMVFEFQPSTRSTDISARWAFKLGLGREKEIKYPFRGLLPKKFKKMLRKKCELIHGG